MSLINKMLDRFDEKKSFRFADVSPFDGLGNWISTGSPSLNKSLKTFGFPSGIIEIRGLSRSGKTTTSLMALKSAQQQYGNRLVAAILSSERRDNMEYARQIGINVDNVIIHRIGSIEDAQNKVRQTIDAAYEVWDEELGDEVLDEHGDMSRKGTKFKELLAKKREEEEDLKFLFIWDSIGQTVSAQEAKKAEDKASTGDTGQAAMASAARALSATFRSIKALEDDYDLTVMCINRYYEKISTFGPSGGKKSYGGQAIELYPSMRLELTKIKTIKIGETKSGQVTQVETIKTDFDLPEQKFEVEIGFGLGYVLTEEDIKLGKQAGILKPSGQSGAKWVTKKGKENLRWDNRSELYDLYVDRDPMLKALITKLTSISRDLVTEEIETK